MYQISIKIIAVLVVFLVTARAKTIESQLYTTFATVHEGGEATELPNIEYDPVTELEQIYHNANDSRVNGGEVVKEIIPFQISMQVYRRNRWLHFCSGSIISPYHVLTAAHCVDNMRATEIHVVAGTLTWNKGGERHRATSKRLHPKYSTNPKIINDIAILKVHPAFNLKKSTIAAVSMGGTQRVGENINVRLSGWGATAPTAAGGLPDKLQQLNYKTISNAECAKKGFRVTGNELCALSNRGQGACVGDSGGPLVTVQYPTQLVGIVSYGSATCAQGRPDVYTRVSSFLPYINKIISSEIP